MSKREYPRIVEGQREKKKAQEGQGKPCIVCGRMTTGFRWVQVWYMRGDDEEARSCDTHKNAEVLIAYKAKIAQEPK